MSDVAYWREEMQREIDGFVRDGIDPVKAEEQAAVSIRWRTMIEPGAYFMAANGTADEDGMSPNVKDQVTFGADGRPSAAFTEPTRREETTP